MNKKLTTNKLITRLESIGNDFWLKQRIGRYGGDLEYDVLVHYDSTKKTYFCVNTNVGGRRPGNFSCKIFGPMKRSYVIHKLHAPSVERIKKKEYEQEFRKV